MKRFSLLAAAAAALPILAATAALPERSAANRGAAYVQVQQQPDGSYSEAAGTTFDAILGLRAAGFDPNKDVTDGQAPADYLRANAATQKKPAEAAKAALAAKALGLDPTDVGGTNLIATITGALGGDGRYASDDFSQSLAMLGLACTGNELPASTTSALKAAQNEDGGWGFQGASDPDTTALALQALLAAGTPKGDAAVAGALAYIRSVQFDDGGWGFMPPSSVNSTAYVIQALLAAGENPDGPEYVRDGASPASFLTSQQQEDGSFPGFDEMVATTQALPALAGRTFCDAPDTPITQVRQQPTLVATATSPASPGATAPATQTAAPMPPAAGSGNDAGGDSVLPVMAALALIALGGGAGTFALRKRR